jgi:hypothetical protein
MIDTIYTDEFGLKKNNNNNNNLEAKTRINLFAKLSS